MQRLIALITAIALPLTLALAALPAPAAGEDVAGSFHAFSKRPASSAAGDVIAMTDRELAVVEGQAPFCSICVQSVRIKQSNFSSSAALADSFKSTFTSASVYTSQSNKAFVTQVQQ